ncbi:V-type ATP synthase subunit C [Halosimplex carlsbadense 2-9-1]|uniref:A-type ATP synthase subunit C n=1 Tax=Halosimplex carlsbadense 2-9-1 TaxID=797114 RepID=M0D2H5_9EURY|nr:V-type ATP synthase subunit C [Halosimplex carlsbadense]ELZ28897.1 V-type ATP synthase subunit C [Halosimplex carlsbadense 2-9-1]
MSAPDQQTSNYEYVNARVRSRRASLFDDDDYRKLVRMGPGEIARFMEESEYETEMNRLGARHDGVDLIEYALNQNLAKHFEDLLRWSDGKLYDYVVRYLRKFDAWNVKTVLRGVYSGADATDVEDDLIRAGEFSEDLLTRLLGAESVDDVVAALEGTIFGEPLEAAVEDYESTGLLVPLENAVDRTFYETLIDDLPRNPDQPTELYVQFLRAEIDFRNVRNVLRLARTETEMDPAEYFIEGGRLFDAEELRQLVEDEAALVERIGSSTYGKDLDEALRVLDDADSLIDFEHALDAALLAYADTLSNRYPLSVCPVLSYVLAKEREINNIRAVARGREAGLSPEQIQEELVVR